MIWFDAFEAETGVKVVDVSTFDFGALDTMVKTGNVEWDLVDMPGSRLGVGVKNGLFEPLDYSVISTDGLDDSQHSDYAIAYNTFATIIGWNTDEAGAAAPTGWTDFWDQAKFPGPRSLRKIPYVQLEAALMADGVAPADLYPLDVDRAFRKLDEIKPYVSVWWETGQQPIDLLSTGEVNLANAFNTRFAAAQEAGAKIDFTFDQGVIASSWGVVAKGAKNSENAMHLIEFMLRPENQAKITESTTVAPANANAFDFIPADRAGKLVTAPENRAKMAIQDEAGFWAENFATINERFLEWVSQ